ncbi:MAG: hypothetical protein Q8R85_18700, partial [Bosea sp. (in: a-proteobacteria)]|uniref:hypothetical protein n=1 Tax=Bosea sp. (in: a-proteobacteria) TaxID=1871050 RepID=UPI002737098A
MALIAAAHIDPIKAWPAPVPMDDTLPRDDETAIAMVDSPTVFLAMQAEWEALFARAGLPHQVF